MSRVPNLISACARLAGRHIRSYRLLRSGDHRVKLHLGCGKQRLDGFVNVDRRPSKAADYIGDIAKLPCRPGTVDRIEAYHVIEHIPRPQVEEILHRWLEWLQPGGTIVLECPDLAQDAAEWLTGNEERLFSIFGRQRFSGDAHHWGYTAESLSALLEQIGFANATSVRPMDYHSLSEPCLRVEAMRPIGSPPPSP